MTARSRSMLRRPSRVAATWTGDTSHTALVTVGVACLALAAGVASALAALGQVGPVLLLCVGAAALLSAAVRLPVRYLPPAALTLTALIPIAYIPVPSLLRSLSPGAILLAAFVIRSYLSDRTARGPRPVAALCIGTAFWLFSGLLWSIAPRATWSWSASVVLSVLLPALFRPDETRAYAGTLLRTWVLLGMALSTFGIVEAASEYNPISSLYHSTDFPIVQVWSVYRITTTLGHPLMNGVFFAVTASLCFGLAVTARVPRRWRFIAATSFALCGAAVALTASRTAVIALMAGVAVSVVKVSISRTTRPRTRVVSAIVFVTLTTLLWNSPIVQARANSAEGVQSSAYRDRLQSEILDSPGLDLVRGSGAGTSQSRVEQFGARLIVENSGLQLLVSIGVIGTTLVALVLAYVLLRGWRRSDTVGLAGAVAFLIASTGFNLWESNPTALVLIGLLSLLCISGAGLPPPSPRPENTFSTTKEWQ